MSQALSNNHFSVDDQIADVVRNLSKSKEYAELMETQFLAEFPEYNKLEWSGSHVDCEASGVDPDYMSFVAEWLEDHTPVTWEDGEPWLNDGHVDYPHEPGYLHDCPGCDAKCHCAPGQSECVYEGDHETV